MPEAFISKAPPQDFSDLNRASAVLAKIGNGTADADFARAVQLALARATTTMKRCRVVVTVDIEPSEDKSSMLLRAEVVAKLAKLPSPASFMHLDERGGLLTQQEFLMGGGPDESTRAPMEGQRPSGRMQAVAPRPALAPLADAPRPQPFADGKSRPSGDSPAG